MCGVFTENYPRAVTTENREACIYQSESFNRVVASTSSLATTIPDAQDCESQGLSILP
jgi:hypothetical protein